MYKFTVLLIFMFICMSMSNALGMSDFESSFLGGIGTNSESPLTTKHNNIRPSSKWRCGDSLRSSNIFCNYGESVAISGDNNFADESRSSINDINTINLSNNYAIPDANQNSLRTTSSATIQQKTSQQDLLNSLSVPIQTGKNLNLNVSPQQIELNIKY